MTTVARPTPYRARPRPTRHPRQRPAAPWAGFAVVLAAMIMNLLDSTIVNVAAPSIQRDLRDVGSALEWIAAAYTLAIAVGLMTGGRLGDMFGRKRMLLLGLTGFVVASAAVRVRLVAGVADRGAGAAGPVGRADHPAGASG